MPTITRTDAATGKTVAPLITNETLMLGERFRLIGNTTVFEAVALHSILGQPAVDGLSLCGKFRTTARVVDTAQVGPRRLYCEGHSHKLGYVIRYELSNAEPVRYYRDLRRARRFMDRYNRLCERAAARSH
jgi:hypothetical protein